jgi:hypothetical protein
MGLPEEDLDVKLTAFGVLRGARRPDRRAPATNDRRDALAIITAPAVPSDLTGQVVSLNRQRAAGRISRTGRRR